MFGLGFIKGTILGLSVGIATGLVLKNVAGMIRNKKNSSSNSDVEESQFEEDVVNK
jgi:hypothetical protein|tara:strand:- start:57 stop:224 length:168 start_codon:yes stop_codon:yes gene_type:complete